MSHPRRIERHFAVGRDDVGHRAFANDVDFDPRLESRFCRGQLHAAQVKRVVTVVLRPCDQSQGLGRVVARQAGRPVDLRQTPDGR